jgi:hypothetical protein
MSKAFLFLSFFCFLSQCFVFAVPESDLDGYWVSKPSGNRLTVIGVSNPMVRREDAIAAAKEDAAKKVSMYYGIQGSIEKLEISGSGFLDYKNEININLLYDPDYSKYIEQLTYDPQTDVFITDKGVFIRFQHTTTATNIDYNARIVNNRPAWINNQDKPNIEGYITAVGVSQNQRYIKDTVFKSVESAAVRMIEELSTVIDTQDVSGSGSSSYIYAVSEGKLINFHVIEFWIDPRTGYVYSLAIAKPAQ